ncbi:MAG: response regulator [Candidatus Omnitrophota bacterium]
MVERTKKYPVKWNVLLAEDDLQARAELLKALSSVAVCTTVETGEKALEAYQKAIKKKKPFDFILLDITMPGPDGFEVLRSIRSFEETAKSKPVHPTRIIMVTAYKDSLMENYNMGWDEFITKPIETEKLIKRMQALAYR